MMRILTLASLVAAMSGCYTVNADLPGTLRGDIDSKDTERVGIASIEITQWYFILGLVGATPRDIVSAELKKQVQAKGADGVANLVWESEFSCLNVAVTGCTAGCVTPRNYKVTGDLVRINKSPLPGKPAKVAQLPMPAAPLVVDAGDSAQRF